uniref:Uncharacterized protein n=1 Tax=Chenopodium quinoa TaxID=63459 RepID=A0A803N2S1_CHEQI
MSIIYEVEEASTSSTSNSTPKCGGMKVQLVSKSKSERLLEKYFDAFEFEFDYEQSGIWSPPIRRTAYVGSPGKMFTEQEMMDRLKSVLEGRNGSCRRSGSACIDVWGCISSLFTTFQKRVKRRREITFGVKASGGDLHPTGGRDVAGSVEEVAPKSPDALETTDVCDGPSRGRKRIRSGLPEGVEPDPVYMAYLHMYFPQYYIPPN